MTPGLKAGTLFKEQREGLRVERRGVIKILMIAEKGQAQVEMDFVGYSECYNVT